MQNLAAQNHPTGLFNYLSGLFKVLVTAALLITLIYKIGWLELYEAVRGLDAGWLALAVIALLIQVIFAAIRWLVLAIGADMPGGRRKPLLIYLVSGIANLIFITSVAGVSVKSALHYRLGASITSVAFSIIIEKMLTLFAMVLTCVLLLLLPGNQAFITTSIGNISENIGAIATRTALLYVLAIAGGLVITALLVHQVISNMQSLKSLLIEHSQAMRAMWRKLFAPAMLSALIASSLITFLAGAVAVIFTANALSQELPVLIFLFLFPAIAIVSALPISVGGWGVREGAMIVVLGLLGVAPENALAISIVYGLLGMVATTFLGAVGYGLLLSEWKDFIVSRKSRTAGQ